MKVLVLAAGRSKRMKPIEDKNFLNFFGKPLIVWQMEALKESGFKDVIIVSGHHNVEKLKQVSKNLEMSVEVVIQENLEMGMCGAVLAAKDLIKGEPVMVFCSNDVVASEAFRLVKNSSESGFDGLLLAKKVDQYFPGGYLNVDSDLNIRSIVEKPKPGTEPSDLVNLVVHYHENSDKLVGYLDNVKSSKDDLYETAICRMIADGMRFKALPYSGFWQPVKFPWHIMPVFRYLFGFARKDSSNVAQIAENATVKGDVIFGENVKVYEGAVIRGPVYIGNNSVIANNALVRESHIGDNCVVGFGTEVARSFFGNDVWTHSNYIGDSVIGNNVSFGAGSGTGNLRLDEQNICVNCDGKLIDTCSNKFGLVTGDDIRVGINVSFMPGVKVGSGSFVAAGIVVGENIPENSFVKEKYDVKIVENKFDPRLLKRDEQKKNL